MRAARRGGGRDVNTYLIAKVLKNGDIFFPGTCRGTSIGTTPRHVAKSLEKWGYSLSGYVPGHEHSRTT